MRSSKIGEQYRTNVVFDEDFIRRFRSIAYNEGYEPSSFIRFILATYLERKLWDPIYLPLPERRYRDKVKNQITFILPTGHYGSLLYRATQEEKTFSAFVRAIVLGFISKYETGAVVVSPARILHKL